MVYCELYQVASTSKLIDDRLLFCVAFLAFGLLIFFPRFEVSVVYLFQIGWLIAVAWAAGKICRYAQKHPEFGRTIRHAIMS